MKKIGLYPIVGDCLHAGHILAMKEAKENCDYLIVAVNAKPEHKEPIQSIFERFVQLNAVKYIDELIPYQGKEDLELLCSSVKHDVRFVGSDYVGKDFDGKQIEKDLNIETYYLSRNHTMSSTNLKQRIKES